MRAIFRFYDGQSTRFDKRYSAFRIYPIVDQVFFFSDFLSINKMKILVFGENGSISS